MNETEFRQRATELGYGEPQVKEYPPNATAELHVHDFSAFAMVADGEFTLGFEDGDTTYRPGDSCEVAAGTRHAEKSGPAGATVWFAKK
jgi:quercetin dioxygenase-like cupin family protein